MKTKRAFTLVELLVVIAMIVALIAMAIGLMVQKDGSSPEPDGKPDFITTTEVYRSRYGAFSFQHADCDWVVIYHVSGRFESHHSPRCKCLNKQAEAEAEAEASSSRKMKDHRY